MSFRPWPTPVWSDDWEGSGIAGVAVSREFAALSFDDIEVLGFEAGAGSAKRFDGQTESEVWPALYLRWKWFPGNDVVKATVALSTGLSDASGISDYELRVRGNGAGSNLMHFFSPEITPALPDKPDQALILRMHHRSGIQDDQGAPGFAPANHADTGATFAAVGLRDKF